MDKHTTATRMLDERDPYEGLPSWVGTTILCLVFPPWILAVIGEQIWRRIISPRF